MNHLSSNAGRILEIAYFCCNDHILEIALFMLTGSYFFLCGSFGVFVDCVGLIFLCCSYFSCRWFFARPAIFWGQSYFGDNVLGV